MDSTLDDLISRRASLHEIRTLALAKGFQPLAVDGLRRVRDGSTSIEEVGRVVDLTDRL
jgi:type II secretory ATPase GspE/PulE/Tfp pilus assembly ATPase PilB-like protein